MTKGRKPLKKFTNKGEFYGIILFVMNICHEEEERMCRMPVRKLASLLLGLTLSCFSFSMTFADFAYGDRGNEVMEIQKQLATLHYSVGELDGVFGPATEQAVKSFQAAKGLTADGVVGDAGQSFRQQRPDTQHPSYSLWFARCALCVRGNVALWL